MHTLTVGPAPRRATIRGPSGAVLALVVSLAAVAAVAPVPRPDLALPARIELSGGTSTERSAVPVPAPGGCGPRTSQLAPGAALDAALACRDVTLAARARALELDPVR